MEPFSLIETDNVHLLALRPWTSADSSITAGITTRIGGVSEPPYQSLNLALHVGDQEDKVIENRMRLSACLGFPFEAWTCAEQVHGSNIYVVKREDIGRGRLRQVDAIEATDGLLTDEENVLLTAFYADCVPLFFYDPEHQAIGVAHAGWKGTAAEIALKMVGKMTAHYGSKPEAILAAIGPSIGLCCYEVDDRVMDPIRETIAPKEGHNIAFQTKENRRYMLDLQECNRQILLKAGIMPYHIEITRRCTSCDTHVLYSHRKEKGSTGRMAAWIGLRGDPHDIIGTNPRGGA